MSRRRAGRRRQIDRAERPERRARRRPDRALARLRRGVDGGQRARSTQRGLSMLDGQRVAVVVPAFEEEHLVAETLSGIPELVDRIYVVDDASADATAERARAVGDPRVEVIVHERNAGVGAAIVTGYRQAIAEQIDVTVVMAADNQMDPAELATLAEPVARGEVDYAKANRLVSGEAWQLIPRSRYLGNAILSLLTKVASATGTSPTRRRATRRSRSRRCARSISARSTRAMASERHARAPERLERTGPRHPLTPHLRRRRALGIKIRRVVPRISWLLVKGFFWRLREKYVIRDFHPLVFFYALGLLMTFAGLLLGAVEVVLRFMGNEITTPTIVLVALLLISGSQFTLFAMWFDMESNKDLR